MVGVYPCNSMRHNFTSWTVLLAAVQCVNAASAPGTENQSKMSPLDAAHPLAKESFIPTMERLHEYKPLSERKELLHHWLGGRKITKPTTLLRSETLSLKVDRRAIAARFQRVDSCPQSLVLWTLQEYCRSNEAKEEDAIEELAKYDNGLEYAFGYSWITHCVAADVLIEHCKEKPVTQIALFLARKDEQSHLSTWRGRFAIARRLLDSKQYTELKSWSNLCKEDVITAAIVKRYANTELICLPKLLAFTPLGVVEDAYTHSPEESRTAVMNMMYVYKSSLDGIEQHERPNQTAAFNVDLLNKDLDSPEYYPALLREMVNAPNKLTMAKQYSFLRTLRHDGVTDIAASAHVALIISSGQGLAPATCFNCVLALMNSSLSNSDFAALGCLSAANALGNTALEILQSSDILPLNVHPDTKITLYISANKLVSFNASQLVSTMITFNHMRVINVNYAYFFDRDCAMQPYIDGVAKSICGVKGCKFFSAVGIDVAMHRAYASHHAILRALTNKEDFLLNNLTVNNAETRNDILQKFYYDHGSFAVMTMSVLTIVFAMYFASPSFMALIHHSVESMGRLPYTEEEVGLLQPAFAFIMDALNDANADVDWIRMMRVCLEITKRTVPELANIINDVKPDRATETYEDIRALADDYLGFNIYELYKRQMPYLYVE